MTPMLRPFGHHACRDHRLVNPKTGSQNRVHPYPTLGLESQPLLQLRLSPHPPNFDLSLPLLPPYITRTRMIFIRTIISLSLVASVLAVPVAQPPLRLAGKVMGGGGE